MREQFEIEKQMLLDAMMGSGETKALKYNEGQPYHILADPESRYAHAWLFQKDGPERGKKYPIQWREITIGRGKENSIIINNDSVSVQHAKIKNIMGVYHVFDLISDSGTFLNSKKLLRPKVLHDWDELKIGRTVFIFRSSSSHD